MEFNFTQSMTPSSGLPVPYEAAAESKSRSHGEDKLPRGIKCRLLFFVSARARTCVTSVNLHDGEIKPPLPRVINKSDCNDGTLGRRCSINRHPRPVPVSSISASLFEAPN